jgi:hypothetical protein
LDKNIEVKILIAQGRYKSAAELGSKLTRVA